MPVVSGPPWHLCEEDLVLVLAEFAGWITNPWATERLHMPYMQCASLFIRERDAEFPLANHGSAEGYCYLCGCRIPGGTRRRREEWTGDNVLLCPSCYEQQEGLVRHIGVATYRELWRKEQEEIAGDG